ncbi:MAG: DMT family transporter [Candidatus Binatia bacterium]
MAEYFAIQAALCFAISHILIRRGLATSNALTGSIISLGLSALTMWVMSPFFLTWSSFFTHAVFYFIAAGIFAPGLGRTFVYMGIERIGVARSTPISNTTPMFASVIAVLLMGETWTLQNFLGTSLVIVGVVTLSRTHGEQHKEWRKTDLVFPILAALSFAVSSNLRKLGLLVENVPIMASAVTATTAFLFVAGVTQLRGGLQLLKISRSSLLWFFAGGMANTAAMLSVFYALSHGKVVVVEPLVSTNPVFGILLAAVFLRDVEVITRRVVAGASCTVVGTLFVVLA